MLFAASSHAFTTSGTASTNALGGTSGNDFYGSVSLAVSASSLVNLQQTADGVGSWNSSFVNTTGIGQDFYAQFSFDRNVSGSATNATGAFVPAYWPGNMDATYASTLNLYVIVGGGSSSYDAAALTLAGGRVPLGFLAPGTSIDLAQLKGGAVVLYFYPKDDTPGCTTEAKDFSCLVDQFKAAGLQQSTQ